jgi:hypothetical protein
MFRQSKPQMNGDFEDFAARAAPAIFVVLWSAGGAHRFEAKSHRTFRPEAFMRKRSAAGFLCLLFLFRSFLRRFLFRHHFLLGRLLGLLPAGLAASFGASAVLLIASVVGSTTGFSSSISSQGFIEATTIVEFARALKRRVTFTPQLYRASFVIHLDTLRAGTCRNAGRAK